MSANEISDLEQQIMQLTGKLHELRKTAAGTPVKNYEFVTTDGSTSLKEMFAGKESLLLIHNMGQACRYCTLWGDGINGFIPHLESRLSVVLVSKDSPQTQRTFANARGWRMRMASHEGGAYMDEQVAVVGMANMPGAVVYGLEGDTIVRKSSAFFGPGDLYCSLWNFLGLAGVTVDQWTPQYSYWQRPASMEDGGENLLEP